MKFSKKFSIFTYFFFICIIRIMIILSEHMKYCRSMFDKWNQFVASFSSFSKENQLNILNEIFFFQTNELNSEIEKQRKTMQEHKQNFIELMQGAKIWLKYLRVKFYIQLKLNEKIQSLLNIFNLDNRDYDKRE